MHSEPSTTDLLHHLTAIRTEAEFKAYLDAHTCSSPSFSAYYNGLLGRKNIPLAAAVKRSSLERHYAYQIVNGTRDNAGRDKIICLCIGAQADLKEFRRALEITKHAPLYARSRRDAIIIKHINQQDWSILNINLELDRYHLETL